MIMGIFNNLVKTYRTIGKEINTCCETLSKEINESMKKKVEESKTELYNNKLKLVNRLKNMDDIITRKEIELLLNNKASQNEVDIRIKQRKQLLKNEINKLSDTPTNDELEKILDLYNN